MKKPERKNLGRGLSALLGDIQESAVPVAESDAVQDAGPRATSHIPIEQIRANPDQPRRDFREAELDELAASIRERGIIQPIIVRPDPKDSNIYQIVAGERRWRAAQRAQLHKIPVVVRELDDRAVLEIAIIENVQRSDLNAIEEAQGYSHLVERYEYTQEKLAEIVGKSRSHLANMLRLLTLPGEVQAMLRAGDLSAGHARALITAPDPLSLARRAVSERLSVRQVEQLARSAGVPARPRKSKPRASDEKDADTRVLEGDLSAAIGMKVAIEHTGDGSGEVRIRYRDLDELDRLCQKLGE